MEGEASGFEEIVKDYDGADLAHKPYIYPKNNQSVIVLPDLANEYGVSIDDKDLMLNKPLTIPHPFPMRIMSFCYSQAHTIKEIADHLGVASSTYFRDKFIKPLLEENFLIEGKKGNAVVFQTNKDIVSVR